MTSQGVEFDAPERLPSPYRPHSAVLESLRQRLRGNSAVSIDWSAVLALAQPWVEAVRSHAAPLWAVESLLQEFPLSSDEGRSLMRLAEALLRVPDVQTAAALTADQLAHASRLPHIGHAHPALGALAATAMDLAQRMLPPVGTADLASSGAGGQGSSGVSGLSGLIQRLGAQAVVAAAVRGVQLLGRQFVFGHDIEDALSHGLRLRKAASASEAPPRFSFDMLGEGARTEADAQRYLAAYAHAIDRLARQAPLPPHPSQGDGISIKLSALFPRYDDPQRPRVLRELLPRVWTLVDRAARAGLNLTIDAEESERLELSLDIFDAVLAQAAEQHPRWAGLGLAVQAYQTRAADVIDTVLALARQRQMRLMLRLVKGAYWDAEIKRAQVLGTATYPVFVAKPQTDLSYLACARTLLAHPDRVYAQFATHNAATIAAVSELAVLAQPRPAHTLQPWFEWQRLHGMGEAMYRQVAGHTGNSASAKLARQTPVRVYAPVGAHRDLLAYLVRRLLENGANASFVNQLGDEQVPPETLLRSPLLAAEDPPADATPWLPDPPQLYAAHPAAPDGRSWHAPLRAHARGLDPHVRSERAALQAAAASTLVSEVPPFPLGQVDAAMQGLARAAGVWQEVALAQRCAVLFDAADRLEHDLHVFCGLLITEGRKTAPDAVAEVRELIDACRYYAAQAQATLAQQLLPGPTGERNELRLRGRGVFVCIAPWNFPLAIFGAQVVAALVAGNAVAAKPAEQTPAVADAFIRLLVASIENTAGPDLTMAGGAHAVRAGDVVRLFHGLGATLGAALVAHPLCAGVAFTGSTQTARRIQRSLADDLPSGRPRPIVPLIAETGGLNAMVVDSTALLEQACDAIVTSAFGSAGQRCSALRLLCVQAEIADDLLTLLGGAMQELVVGPPEQASSDIGPVIDAQACAHLQRHIARLDHTARLIARTPLSPLLPPGDWVAPCAYEIARVSDLQEEIFGPVLHVLRFGPGTRAPTLDSLLEQIQALGYGLTLGVQTRIDSRARHIAQVLRVGNVYVNRSMTGAVIGVQPFGGEGLSGTGPKAGGPHYLLRFVVEQTVTINTAAAGGNAELLATRRAPGRA